MSRSTVVWIQWACSLVNTAGLLTFLRCSMRLKPSFATSPTLAHQIKRIRPITGVGIVAALVCVLTQCRNWKLTGCQVPQVTSSIFLTILTRYHLSCSHWTWNASETAGWLAVMSLQACSVLPMFGFIPGTKGRSWLWSTLAIACFAVAWVIESLWFTQHASQRRLFETIGSGTRLFHGFL